MNIEKWKDCKKAAFSSSWDDMTMTSLFDITTAANKRDIKTTIYINGINQEWKTTVFLGNDFKKTTNLVPNKKIVERLKFIYSLGNEIGNHTFSHKNLKNINHNHIIAEILKCNKLIHSITKQKEFTFSYPWGNTPSEYQTQNFLKQNFIACRGAEYVENIITNPNFEYLKPYHIGPHPYSKNTKELNSLIDKTIEKNGWLIEYGHGWDNDGWAPIEKKTLLKHFDYIATKNIWCDTILNISKYIKQRNSIKFFIKRKNRNEYILSFKKIINTSPLTFSFRGQVEIFQNNKKIEIQKNKNKYFFTLERFENCIIKKVDYQN